MHFVDDVAPEELAAARQAIEDAAALHGFGTDRLVRVIGIGQTREDQGVTLELIALEVRQHACRLIWRARSQSRDLGLGLVLSVTDDLDTAYRVITGGGSAGGGLNGVMSHADGEMMVAPTPPAGATRLTIAVTSVEGSRSMSPFLGERSTAGTDGDWRFEIELR
jgi:hypothetical protein